VNQIGPGAADPASQQPRDADDRDADDDRDANDRHNDSTAASQRDLSVLEDALRRALATAPRQEVVRSIAAIMPIEIDVAHSSRLHGGKVRKVSVSMPEELAEAVRARTGTGGFSGYVTDAVQEKIRLDLLGELSAELEAEYGPIPAEIRKQTRREWQGYEEESAQR
jgi:hypothetical protein